MSAGVLVIIPVCPGSQGQQGEGRRGPEASWGVFLGPRRPRPAGVGPLCGGRAVLAFHSAAAAVCSLSCELEKTNVQVQDGCSTPAVLLVGFCNPVPLGK